MKTFAVASIIALASLASAQLDNIPSCALSCLIGPLTSDGCSALTDFKCHCQKGSSLLSTVQPCIQGACSASDQATVISAVQSTCAGVGVPIQIPNQGGASSAAPASSRAASSAAAPAVSSAVSAASSQAAAISSAASAVSSVISRASTAAASASASNSVPSTPVSQFTGGAPQATKAAGLLGAAAIAMLAL